MSCWIGGNLVKYFKFIRKFGFLAFIEEVLERRKLWELKTCDFVYSADSSSFSDTLEYVSIVNIAAESDETFNRFRSNRQYRQILEHVTKDLGDRYLSEIKSLEKEYLQEIPKNKIIVFLDLGSGTIREISQLPNLVYLIDHHEMHLIKTRTTTKLMMMKELFDHYQWTQCYSKKNQH
jgi:HD superfamily phosphohydrolase